MTRFLIAGMLLAPLPALRAAEPEIDLKGAIDLHCHSGPDTVARSLTSFDVVRQARTAGLRAIVLKNHFAPTAALAQLAQQEVGGVPVFGGVVLNRAAGGLNAEAVRRMAQVEGRRGKIVWLPTFDAEAQVTFSKETRPFVRLVEDGRPVAEFAGVLRAIVEADLVLATGHASPAESIVLLAAARAAGVKRMLATHVLSGPSRATREQMQRLAELGGLLECTWLTHLPEAGGPAVPVRECAEAIRAVGAEHFVLTSDLGQAGHPKHVDGLRTFIAALLAAGVSEADIRRMTRENPARLLGLEPLD